MTIHALEIFCILKSKHLWYVSCSVEVPSSSYMLYVTPPHIHVPYIMYTCIQIHTTSTSNLYIVGVALTASVPNNISLHNARSTLDQI